VILRVSFALLLILIPLTLFSEIEPVPLLGISSGYNLSQLYGTKDQTGDYKVKTGIRHGFSTGINLNLPVTDRLALMYELNYVTKGAWEKITIQKFDGETLAKPGIMNVTYHMDYLEFPVLLQYKVINTENISLRAVSGVAMALKVKGDYRLDGKIYFPSGEEEYSIVPIKDKSNLKDINMFDFSLIYGGEFRFNIRKTPIVLSYRFTIGWDYMALPTYNALELPPVNLRNQSYALTVRVPILKNL